MRANKKRTRTHRMFYSHSFAFYSHAFVPIRTHSLLFARIREVYMPISSATGSADGLIGAQISQAMFRPVTMSYAHVPRG